MTNIDISIFQNMTQEQFIAYAHKQTAIPSLIFLWVSTLLIFLIIGLLSTQNKSKFLGIFFFTLLCSGIILVVVCLLPNTIHSVVTAISNLFS